MSKKTVETTASGLAQFTGMKNLSPLDTEEVTEIGQYFNKSGGGGGEGFEPTEAQLEAMNSGITSTKVATYDTLPNEDDVKDIISDHFVAGTNVTITDNADGTQTIASTGGGGFTPTQAQQDAMDSGITTEKVTSYDNMVGELQTSITNAILNEIIPNPRVDMGSFPSNGIFSSVGISNEYGFVLTYKTREFPGAWHIIQLAVTPKKIAAREYVGGDWYVPHLLSVPIPTASDDGKVLTVTVDQTMTPTVSWEASSTPTPPTAYSPVTNNTWTDGGITYSISGRLGGYVVSNNICTVNIRFNMNGSGGTPVPGGMLGKILFKGLPKPKSGVSVFLPMNQQVGNNGVYRMYTLGVAINSSGELRGPSEIPSSWTSLQNFVISGSYLVDPTWTPT